ncbi:cutinase family protein [Nocardia sp. XZ_19_369]|uniref:cutinase family protein n=1 Tax=Nocardia sp. XZ_19_369 TaxID=2769487 RepID=UPI00188FA3BC|nr:cutinase family protein [Nocardia sp. XZ_19_369]
MNSTLTARIAGAATTAALACTLMTATANGQQPAPDCAPLHLLLANSTTESTPEAATDRDTGFGAQIATPAQLAVNREGRTLLSRSYVPYSASETRPSDPAANPHSQAVSSGIGNATKLLTDQAQKCPNQKMFLVGYSQGAQIMTSLASDIAAGKGPIPADRVAGVAVFSSPIRAAGSPVFPGGQSSPAKVPGAAGSSVAHIRIGTAAPPRGGGIAPTKSAVSLGGLAARTASFCSHGDLACDTPADAALARVVGGIASQSTTDSTDPIGILTSVGSAVGQSILYTGAKFITDSVSFNSSTGRVEVRAAGPTVMDRLVEASNPNVPKDGVGEAIKALTKIAGMGISAVISVAKDVLSPSSIGQIAAAGLAGPEAALAMLGTKVAGAAVKLVSPVTVENTVKLAFRELEKGVVDNAGLVSIALDTNYWNTTQQHTSYFNTPIGANGQTPVQLTAEWIAAAAEDLTGAPAKPTTTPAVKPSTGPLLASPDQQVIPAAQILAGRP